MRPNTLAEAIERILSGEPREKAFAEFLDRFYGLQDSASRSEALLAEPVFTGEARLDALAGAIAEYLAKQNGAQVPVWVSSAARTLAEPWFTTERPGSGINEYLWHASPAEFRSRNIFTDSQPLRRAAQRVSDG